VPVEREGLVLGEDVDVAEVGVDAVGESDVDDAVHSAEGDGGLGAIPGERIEALSGAACEKDSECVFHRTASEARRERTPYVAAIENSRW